MNIFLSYSPGDKAFAEKLRSRLLSAGLRVWDESHEVLPGENWARKIGDALEESNAMVVLLSPDAIKSRMVRREIEYALGSSRYENRLLPVIVRPTKGIPWILEKMQMLRVKDDPEQTARHVVKILKSKEPAKAGAGA